jgi:hypothetical protein
LVGSADRLRRLEAHHGPGVAGRLGLHDPFSQRQRRLCAGALRRVRSHARGRRGERGVLVTQRVDPGLVDLAVLVHEAAQVEILDQLGGDTRGPQLGRDDALLGGLVALTGPR